MKLLVILAFLFAVIGAGFLIATVFTTGSALVYASIGAGLCLAAIKDLIEGKTVNQKNI